MERLTVIDDNGYVCRKNCEISDCDAWNKLAIYENLEEQGLLPILHVGDDIYFRAYGMNQFGEHVDFIQTQKITRIDIDLNGILYCTASVKFIYNEVGSKVFLSRAEADEYLKSKQI